MGICHQVERSGFVAVELGYQLGFQSMSVNDTDSERSSRLFHLGLGVGWYL